MGFGRDDLPLAESASVLVSVLGFDYLVDGETSMVGALAVTAAVAGTCIGIRCWRKIRRR